MRALLLLAVLQAGSLGPEHQIFLEEEAHFLLSSREREEFLSLETKRERDDFVERFWRVHDPTAHAERLGSSDRLFAPRGRHSERGRLYQLLGPPATRQRFGRSGGEVALSELWQYRGVSNLLLPESFDLIFFRPGGAVDLRLWSPAADGLAALVTSHEPLSDREALERLRRVDAELALAAEGLVPGAGANGAQSLVSSLTGLADLLESDRIFSTRVEATAAMRTLDAELTASIWPDDAGLRELHYALSLDLSASDRLPWTTVEGRERVMVRVIVRVAGGLAADVWDDDLVLDVSANERERLQTTVLSFQGRKLLRDSADRVSVVLLAGDVTASGEASIGPAPFLAVATGARPGNGGLPFRAAEHSLVPLSARPLVSPSILVAAPFLESTSGSVDWTLWRDGVLWRSADGDAKGLAVHEVVLEGGEHEYRARAVRGTESREIHFRGRAARRGPIRVIARERTGVEQRAYRRARAFAFLERDDLRRAVESLELADGGAHVALGRELYRRRRYEGLLEHLRARADSCQEPDLYVLLAAAASALGRFSEAVAHYESALRLSPESPGIRDALERARTRGR